MAAEYGFVETQFTNQEEEARGNIMNLLGDIQNVVGDGSCFIYAVLLGMKQLDHRAGMRPSARDLQVQQDLRERIAQWWIDHPTVVDIDANGYGDGRHLDDAVSAMLEGPVYEGTNLVQSGGYGGETAFLALANILKVDIVVWNAAAAIVAIPSVLQYGDEDRVRRNWSFVQMWQRMIDETHPRRNIPLIHVQFNGRDHYQAWIVTKVPDNDHEKVHCSCSKDHQCDCVFKKRRRDTVYEEDDVALRAKRLVKRRTITEHCRVTKRSDSKRAYQEMYRATKLSADSKRASQEKYRATKLSADSKRASQEKYRATKLSADSKRASQEKYRATKLSADSKRVSQEKYCATKLTPESKRASQERYRETKLTPESKRASDRLYMSKKSDADLADIRKKRRVGTYTD